LRPGRFYGRAEPAPPRGRAKARWPSGERPGDDARGGFLGRTHSVRPPGKAERKPGHFMITDGRTKGWWPKRDNISVGVMSTLRACGARSSAGRAKGEMAFRRKARGSRDGRFSRRDALCASAWQGRAQAGAFHDYGRASERLVAEKTQRLGSPDVDITGVRSPPLRGVSCPRRDGLAEEGPEIARWAVFSEGRALCVRVARP